MSYSGFNGVSDLLINGNNLYVSNYGNSIGNGNTISLVNLINGNIILNWATGLFGPQGMAINGNYLYVSDSTTGNISQIWIGNGNMAKPNWATGLTFPSGIVIDTNGTYMYAANYGNIINYNNSIGNICQINMTNGTISNANWSVNLKGMSDMVINGSYLYVANTYDANNPNIIGNSITQINFPSGTIANANWATGLNGPYGIVIDSWGQYMYVSNYSGSGTTVSQINMSNGSISNNFITGLNAPDGLALNGTLLYVGNYQGNVINSYNIPIPNSNICFPKNTPVKTDQGIIFIENIKPSIHTIKNKPITFITKTITQDDYLVCFKKDSLGINYPIEETVISKEHKILYKGKMKEAKKFIEFDNVYTKKYNGEVLYNILMETHETIEVNNLICETLDPNNLLSKIYHTVANDRDDIIKKENIKTEYK